MKTSRIRFDYAFGGRSNRPRQSAAPGKTAALFAGLLLAGCALACGAHTVDRLERLALKAVSADAAVSGPAITALRASGPAGLQALLTTHAQLLQRQQTNTSRLAMPAPAAEWKRLSAALDAVGEQHDCHASRLYWFTDFAQAKAAARASGKPILSLRLLGRLDEEFSCANSRFFRTTLYANAEVSQYLRDHFVLHWKSVRPVPRVTIDFGDGRKLERTITGNSIHYVLDAQGRPIDALPGLYGPQAFVRGLARAESVAQNSAALAEPEREKLLREYHQGRLAALAAEWSVDLAKATSNEPARPRPNLERKPVANTAVAAREAGRLAKSKALVEVPVLRAIEPGSSAARTILESTTDEALWAKIGALHAEEARLDANSIALVRSKTPTAVAASRLTATKAAEENPLLRALRNLERSMAADTAWNEYRLHARIHEWLLAGGLAGDLESLNTWVYAQLFLTPDSDPWLGLVPPDTFSALENGGIVTDPTR
jgi:hypothetical protein